MTKFNVTIFVMSLFIWKLMQSFDANFQSNNRLMNPRKLAISVLSYVLGNIHGCELVQRALYNLAEYV